MQPVTTRLTHFGIAVTMIGFGVLVFTWGEVAGLANVALQMPYLLSGGMVGVGMILTGLTLIVVNARQIEAAEHQRELADLHQELAQLASLLTRVDEPGSTKAAARRPRKATASRRAS